MAAVLLKRDYRKQLTYKFSLTQLNFENMQNNASFSGRLNCFCYWNCSHQVYLKKYIFILILIIGWVCKI